MTARRVAFPLAALPLALVLGCQRQPGVQIAIDHPARDAGADGAADRGAARVDASGSDRSRPDAARTRRQATGRESVRRGRRRACRRERHRRCPYGRRRRRGPEAVRAPGSAAGLRALAARVRGERRAALRRSRVAAASGARRGALHLVGPGAAAFTGGRPRAMEGGRSGARPAVRLRGLRRGRAGRRPRRRPEWLARRAGSDSPGRPLRRERRHCPGAGDPVHLRAHRRLAHRAARSGSPGRHRHRRLLRDDGGHAAHRRGRGWRGQAGLRDQPGRHARLSPVRVQRAAAGRPLGAPRVPELPAIAGRHRRPRRALPGDWELGRRERLQHAGRDRPLDEPTPALCAGPGSGHLSGRGERQRRLLCLHLGRRPVRRPQRDDVHPDLPPTRQWSRTGRRLDAGRRAAGVAAADPGARQLEVALSLHPPRGRRGGGRPRRHRLRAGRRTGRPRGRAGDGPRDDVAIRRAGLLLRPRPRLHRHGRRRHPLSVAGQRRRSVEVRFFPDRVRPLLAGLRVRPRVGGAGERGDRSGLQRRRRAGGAHALP